METDGQSREALSESTLVAKEQSPVHSRHSARYLSTFEVNCLEVRGSNAYFERLRVF